jgi:hypothetical protein
MHCHRNLLIRDLEGRVARREIDKAQALAIVRAEVAKVRQKLRVNEERLNSASDSKPQATGGTRSPGGGNRSCSPGQRDRGSC